LVHQYVTLAKQQRERANAQLQETHGGESKLLTEETLKLVHAERVWGLFNALWGDVLSDTPHAVPSMDDVANLVSQLSDMTNATTIGKTLRVLQGTQAHEAVVYETVASVSMQQRQSLLISEALESVNMWVRQVLAEMDGEGLSHTQTDPSAQEPGHALASGRIEEACEKAIEHGNFRLATLLAQAAGDLGVRDLVLKQLELWREQGVDRFIDSHLLDAMQLLGGQVEQRQVAERHWLRGLALHLWHKNPALAPLTWASKSFRDSLWELNTTMRDQELNTTMRDASVVLPLPWYVTTQRSDCGSEGSIGEAFENDVSTGPGLDTMYHLVRLAADHETYPLRKVLEPAGHTSDVLDYSLSWHLYEVLHCLTPASPFGHGLTHNQRCMLHMSFAFQLESAVGMWPWAVYVVHQLDSVDDAVVTSEGTYVRIMCV
jgi:hypothetical protein